MPRFRFLVTAAVTAGLLSFTTLAWSWGDDGHTIVGDIAEHYLTDTARQQVIALLKADNSTSLGEVSVWADRIKRKRPELNGALDRKDIATPTDQ